MKYFSACFLILSAVSIASHAIAEGGKHGTGFSGSVGVLVGELRDPDSAFGFAGRLDYFMNPEDYLLAGLDHERIEYREANNNDRVKLGLTYLDLGVGREVAIASAVGFFAEGALGLGQGDLRVVSGNNRDRLDIDSTRLRFGLGFRGTVGGDQWTLGGDVIGTRFSFGEPGIANEEDIDLAIYGSGLFRLTNQTLLGPYARYALDAEYGEIGLRLRLDNW